MTAKPPDPPGLAEYTPEAVAACVVNSATPNTLSGVGSDTPNKLLYTKEP